MRTKKELNTHKGEVENMSLKPHALTDDELVQVSGGKTMQQNGRQKLSGEEIENSFIEDISFIEG